jgi:hypothetical protein
LATSLNDAEDVVKRALAPTDKSRRAIDECSIDACSRCKASLGLIAPTIHSPARCWLCGHCGSAYFAVAAERISRRGESVSARPVVYDQVLAAATIDVQRSQVPRQELHGVLKYLATLEHQGFDKRRQPRYAIAMPVRTLPLGRNFRVTGPAVEMTTINISCGGAALLDEESCNAAYLAVDLTHPSLGTVQAILQVLRARPLMSAFEIAGRWHCRVDAVNCSSGA